MAKHTLRIFILFFILLSCNNKKEVSDKVEKPIMTEVIEKVNLKEFKIKAKIKVDKKCVIRFSANNIKIDEGKRKNVQIFQNIDAIDEFVELDINFGEVSLPKSTIFNLGSKNTNIVQFESIEIIYGKNNLLINNNEDLKKFFKVSDYIVLNDKDNSMVTKEINGKIVPNLSSKLNMFNLLSKD